MSDDENKHPFTDAEARLVSHGATKIVSLWWSKPYVMGVLLDGRTVIVSEPSHMPAKNLDHPGPPPDLVAQVEDGECLCQECQVYGEENVAVDVAYCCGLQKWLPVCREHHDEMGGYGPEDCP